MDNTIKKNSIRNEPRSIVMPKSKPKKSASAAPAFVAILVVAAAALVYVFNVGGIKDVLSMKHLASKTVESDMQYELGQQKNQIKLDKAAIEAEKSKLTQRETELDEKEHLIAKMQQEADDLKSQLQVQLEDIKSLSVLYEKMDPASAAKIIMQYPDKKAIANVIKNMNSARAAEVLSEMDAKTAAELLKLLSENKGG